MVLKAVLHSGGWDWSGTDADRSGTDRRCLALIDEVVGLLAPSPLPVDLSVKYGIGLLCLNRAVDAHVHLSALWPLPMMEYGDLYLVSSCTACRPARCLLRY